MKELLKVRRNTLHELRREKIYDDELVRSVENSIDLEEARIWKQY